MRTTGLIVGGMRCRHCVREVTARLRDVPGFDTVAADADRSIEDGGRGPKELTDMVDLTRDQHGQVHARLLDLVPGRSGQVLDVYSETDAPAPVTPSSWEEPVNTKAITEMASLGEGHRVHHRGRV